MFTIFKKIGWFMNKYKWLFILAAIGDILAGTMSVLAPQILGRTIDLLTKNQLTLVIFYQSIGGLIGLTIFAYICNVLWVYLLFGLGIRFEQEFRGKFYHFVMKMGGTFFKKYAVGDLMVRVTTDLKQVAAVTSEGFFFLIEGTIFLLLIVVAMLVTTNVKLVLITIIPLLFVTWIISIIGNKISKYHGLAQNKLSKLSETLLEAAKGEQVLRAYRQESRNVNILSQQTHAVKKLFGFADNYDNLSIFLLFAFWGGAEFLVFYFGGMMVFHAEITAGELVTFILYFNMIGWPLFSLGNVFGILKRGDASFDRIQEVLENQPEVISNVQEKVSFDFEKLEFNQYYFQYPNADKDDYALKNINFVLKKGQTLGVVGKVGGGRTTLVRQLLGEYALQDGDMVKINDKPYSEYHLSDIRELFGYVPQEHILFSKSVKDNLRIAKENATEEEIQQAIRLADFEKDIQFLNDGLETLTGESGAMLSGGQKQRLAIARAFLKDPEILILDDALSAVDGKTEAKIIDNILQYRQGKTNIIIAHRLSAVKHADIILVLDNGVIIEQGNDIELMKNKAWYYEQAMYQSLEVE